MSAHPDVALVSNRITRDQFIRAIEAFDEYLEIFRRLDAISAAGSAFACDISVSLSTELEAQLSERCNDQAGAISFFLSESRRLEFPRLGIREDCTASDLWDFFAETKTGPFAEAAGR